MNQVMEMLRLVPGASEDDAVTRLSTLFEMMSRAKGFHEAEVLRSTEEAGLLLVLHMWDSIDDWHAFQSSDMKIAFSASRPAFLYAFVPCGMNWLVQSGLGRGQDGAFLRRQVIREPLTPHLGPDVVSSQTFSYQDYEPALADAMLRLTRLRSAPSQPKLTGECVLTDDVYESVHRHGSAKTPAESYLTAGG